jgi:hypothetical protein
MHTTHRRKPFSLHNTAQPSIPNRPACHQSCLTISDELKTSIARNPTIHPKTAVGFISGFQTKGLKGHKGLKGV